MTAKAVPSSILALLELLARQRSPVLKSICVLMVMFFQTPFRLQAMGKLSEIR
jgi:hypothetical protein